jgi:hypothetical protein
MGIYGFTILGNSMAKEKLYPDQWVVNMTTLTDSFGLFWLNAGGTLTTILGGGMIFVTIVLSFVYRSDVQAGVAGLLGAGGAGAIGYDPKKGNTVNQQFQQPVDNAIAAVPGSQQFMSERGVRESPASLNITNSGYTLPEISTDLDDDGEWLTPEQLVRR